MRNNRPLHCADIKKEYRIRKLLAQERPSEEAARKAVESVVKSAGARMRRGERADRYLFALEEDVLKISDSLLALHELGMDREYRDLWEKLYLFVQSCGQSEYMPLRLFILYRYAHGMMCTGEPEKAEKLYRDLLESTDSMIGTDNTYGILCWDRIGTAAAAAGKAEEAVKAYEEALRIAERILGLYSPLTLAVQHRLAVLQSGEAAKRNRRDLYLKMRAMMGEMQPLTLQLQAEYKKSAT